jgi:hypothetical protein
MVALSDKIVHAKTTDATRLHQHRGQTELGFARSDEARVFKRHTTLWRFTLSENSAIVTGCLNLD